MNVLLNFYENDFESW
jgi:hypothetical protein